MKRMTCSIEYLPILHDQRFTVSQKGYTLRKQQKEIITTCACVCTVHAYYVYKLMMISQNQLLHVHVQIHKFFMCFKLQAHFTFWHDLHGGNGPDKPKVIEVYFSALNLSHAHRAQLWQTSRLPFWASNFPVLLAQWAKAQVSTLPTK